MHPSVVYMLENDAFSQWLALEVVQAEPDFCILRMLVRAEMLNGFKVLHGGVAASFADSALAFAANHSENLSIVLDSSIHYPASAREGDLLEAQAKLIYATRRTAVYDVNVTSLSAQKLILTLRGTVFRTEIKVGNR